MSYQATGWAAKVGTGSHTLKAVLMSLAQCASPEGVVFARQDTLEWEMELDRTSIARNVKRLANLGLLRVFTRYGKSGRRSSNVIVLMMDCQWAYRANHPVGCEEYFANHEAKEEPNEQQQKVFEKETLPDYRRKRHSGKLQHRQSAGGTPTKRPVGSAVDEIDKALKNNDSESLPGSLPEGNFGGTREGYKSLERNARDAREDDQGEGEKPKPGPGRQVAEDAKADQRVEKPETLKAWWRGHRGLLEAEIGQAEYEAWLDGLICAEDDKATVTLWAPSRFIADRVESQYLPVLRSVLMRETVRVVWDWRAAKGKARERDSAIERGDRVVLARDQNGEKPRPGSGGA